MNTDEIRKLDPATLLKELSKSRQELLKIRLQTSDQRSKETHKLKNLRKHIARIKTATNQVK